MTEASSPARRAAVVGGGIAGLATAAMLARTGWEVRLFERRAAIGADATGASTTGANSTGTSADDECRRAGLGAGIQISPNAWRCLAAIGAAAAVEAATFRPHAAVLRDGVSGREIYRAALGEAAVERWGAPYLHVHRADLVDALERVARAACVELHPGRSVDAIEDGTDALRLRHTAVAGGAEEMQELSADLCILADGLGSRLRGLLFGETPRVFTGQTAWRALVPATAGGAAAIPPDATVWAAPGRHAVTYYVSAGRFVNLVAVEEASRWEGESWVEPGDPARLRAAFTGLHPTLTALLEEVSDPLFWGLFERPAPGSWSRGRVVMLGDAVHAMLPFMAQGAAMALEDAVVLSRALGRDQPLPEALAAFEAERRPRVERVAATSRSNGKLFHRAGPLRLAEQAVVGAVSRLAPGVAAGRLDWIYGYDATLDRSA
ncbi:MAG: FAD-dependent oxidoreductase [Pseudomonadota bacterium]